MAEFTTGRITSTRRLMLLKADGKNEMSGSAAKYANSVVRCKGTWRAMNENCVGQRNDAMTLFTARKAHLMAICQAASAAHLMTAGRWSTPRAVW